MNITIAHLNWLEPKVMSKVRCFCYVTRKENKIVPLLKQDQQAFNIPNLITNFHDFFNRIWWKFL